MPGLSFYNIFLLYHPLFLIETIIILLSSNQKIFRIYLSCTQNYIQLAEVPGVARGILETLKQHGSLLAIARQAALPKWMNFFKKPMGNKG